MESGSAHSISCRGRTICTGGARRGGGGGGSLGARGGEGITTTGGEGAIMGAAITGAAMAGSSGGVSSRQQKCVLYQFKILKTSTVAKNTVHNSTNKHRKQFISPPHRQGAPKLFFYE